MTNHLAIATAVVGGLGGLFGLIMLVYRFMATMLGEKFVTRLDHEKIEEKNQNACIRNRLAQTTAQQRLAEQIRDLNSSISKLTDEIHNVSVNIDWIKDIVKKYD